jgi:uncharacterized membrane protein YidH (DUF202 family)
VTSATDDSEPDEDDRGLAQERTSLAWTRTAIAFAALGGAVLKANAVTGLIILAVAMLVWQIGRVTASASSASASAAAQAGRILLITVSVAIVALLCLLVALLGPAVPGTLR